MIAGVFFDLLEPLVFQVSHHFGVLLFFEPCLKFDNSHACEVEIVGVVGAHELVDVLHDMGDFVEFSVEFLAGVNELVDHGMEVELEEVEPGQFVFIRLEYIKEHIVNNFILGEAFDIVGRVGVNTHETEIAFAVSEDGFEDLVVVIVDDLHFFASREPVLGIGLHELAIKGVLGVIL